MKNEIYSDLPAKVRVRDVTLRDGLQSIRVVLPTATKLEIYDALAGAGVQELQVTSFVNPARVPQLADANELWAALARRPERRSVLVANLRGFERALAAGTGEIEAVVSLSDSYNINNAHRTTRRSLDEILAMARLAQDAQVHLTVALANCYHCMFQGWTNPQQVFDAIEELDQSGVREILICDTTGYATPDQVYEVSREARSRYPETIFGAHLHDTRGRALANAVAAMQAGIAWFDCALAGLGGSPFAPGMGGNLSLETLADTLAEMRIETGLDVGKILQLGDFVRNAISAGTPVAAD